MEPSHIFHSDIKKKKEKIGRRGPTSQPANHGWMDGGSALLPLTSFGGIYKALVFNCLIIAWKCHLFPPLLSATLSILPNCRNIDRGPRFSHQGGWMFPRPVRGRIRRDNEKCIIEISFRWRNWFRLLGCVSIWQRGRRDRANGYSGRWTHCNSIQRQTNNLPDNVNIFSGRRYVREERGTLRFSWPKDDGIVPSYLVSA